MILGLDIGGANTKAASSDAMLAESVYLPLWQKAPLDDVLQHFASLEPRAVGVVITGELADCFARKSGGIEAISAAVKEAFSCPVHFWGVGGFGSPDLAGANWSASASLLAAEMGDCLFVDMGSTTTDLIPIVQAPQASRTDFLRLADGELIYTGLLRTSLAALLPAVHIRGMVVPLSSELFAITADAYLAMDLITEEDYSCDTPDGAKKGREASLRRLARAVCADLEEIGESGALAIAWQARDTQLKILVKAIEKQARGNLLSTVVAAGIGEGIIYQAAASLGMECILLSERYGPEISAIFPAYAVARLLEESLLKTNP